eukprot:2163415-Pyramimonas_sp.AAC.1
MSRSAPRHGDSNSTSAVIDFIQGRLAVSQRRSSRALRARCSMTRRGSRRRRHGTTRAAGPITWRASSRCRVLLGPESGVAVEGGA